MTKIKSHICIKKDHRGMSLVELVVSLLIASVVVIAIGGFLSVGTKSYLMTNTETQLQKESQIALNQIEDLMLVAQSYDYQSYFVASKEVPVLLITTLEKESGIPCEYYHAIVWNKETKILSYRKISMTLLVSGYSSDLNVWGQAMAEEETDAMRQPSLLANYVDSLRINPVKSDKEKAVTITLKLNLNGKDYQRFTTVTMRNR